jgi:vancomycin resistance protein YoaR
MAVTTRTLRPTRALRIPRLGRHVRGFAIGALLGVAIGLVALIALRWAYEGRIVPGVHAAGVDLSGMTPGQAEAALDAALAPLEAGAITVTSPRGTLTLGYDDVARTVDVPGMVAAAASEGRGGSRLDEVIGILDGVRRPVTLPTLVTFDGERLVSELAAFGERATLPPIGARVIQGETGFEIVPAVPGLTVDATGLAATLEAALSDPASPATIEAAAATARLAPPTTNVDVTRAKATAEAIAQELTLTNGKKDWPIRRSRIRTWISFSGTGASYGPVIDEAAIPAALKNAAKGVLRKPRDATFLKTRGGDVFGVAAAGDGRALDVDKTVGRILAALEARAAGTAEAAPVKLATAKVAPDVTTEEATASAPLVSRIGTWTTYYQAGPRNGNSANIVVPARRLDGQVVRPGQTFEFWGALGEVSFRTGYRLGAAIIGGRTVQDRALAGGICAVSTTLFNAAARAGLEILSRRPHYYYISRYPLGLDATVSDAITMRFRNDTKNPILIKASASGSFVRFDLWSIPNGRTVTWSRPSVSNVVPGRDSVQYTSSLPKGVRERTEYPVDGMDVAVTRTVRNADGSVIHRDTFVSHYKRMIGVVLVGR